MAKAFLETTVLTNLLLKRDGSEKQAEALLSTFDEVIVPQFSWKEFKRGPLSYFRWAHNKLADTGSFLATMAALQRLSMSPKRYLTATGIQALHTALSNVFEKATLGALAKQYGRKADPDVAYADALRGKLKLAIVQSWTQRRTLFGGQKQILSCYPDREIDPNKALLDLKPFECPKGQECCLNGDLGAKRSSIALARGALDGSTQRKEILDRRQLLKHLEKHPPALQAIECRILGDAYFVLFCPIDAKIVTVNVRDIEPMARALNIEVEVP